MPNHFFNFDTAPTIQGELVYNCLIISDANRAVVNIADNQKCARRCGGGLSYRCVEGAFLWLLVAEGGADGGAEFGVLGYVEAHFVEVLNHLEDDAALRYLGKVAYWHNVLDATVEGA